MDSYHLSLLVVFLVCIVLSAFFSGSEVAFFSLKEEHLLKFRKSKNSSEKIIIQLLDNSKSLLSTILLGNTVVNVTASIVAAVVTLEILEQNHLDPLYGFLIEVVCITFTLLILSEITPKVIAANRSVNFAKFSAPLMYLIVILLSPITFVLNKFASLFSFSFKNREHFSGEDVKTIADVVHEQGNIEENEREMINSIVEFKDLTVKEIMVSRLDMIAVSSDTTYQEFMKLIQTEGHSRVPLYEDSLDNIIGIVYVKDLITFLANQEKSKTFDIRKISRQPLFVPEGKKLDDLLKEFQTKKMHIAIVVDEYGGTAGLVTMEDVIEQIIGDIQDEYDEESPMFKKIGPDSYIFDGKIPIEEAEQILNIKLEIGDEKFETLAGFILALAGTIPKEKAVFKKDNVQFIVEQLEVRRISKIRTVSS